MQVDFTVGELDDARRLVAALRVACQDENKIGDVAAEVRSIKRIAASTMRAKAAQAVPFEYSGRVRRLPLPGDP